PRPPPLARNAKKRHRPGTIPGGRDCRAGGQPRVDRVRRIPNENADVERASAIMTVRTYEEKHDLSELKKTTAKFLDLLMLECVRPLADEYERCKHKDETSWQPSKSDS